MDRNINKWQKLNELRKTDPRISGGYYTTEFLKTYNPISIRRDTAFSRNL